MKIYYFTNSYPYGQPDHWKTVELEEMISRGHEVTLVPFSDGSNPEILVDLLEKVNYMPPLVRKGSVLFILRILTRSVFSFLPLYFLQEYFKQKVYKNRKWLQSWVRDSYYTAALYFHPLMRELIRDSDCNTVWYFFWGRHSALIIPLLKRKKFKIACRFHKYDLYLDQNYGYIPYHEKIIQGSNLLLPCSDYGARDLDQKTGHKVPVQVARLGVPLKGPGAGKNEDNLEEGNVDRRPARRDQGPLTGDQGLVGKITELGNFKKIVTCSAVVEVKRLMLLAQSLEYLDFPLSWTHIGDGARFEELRNFCKRFENSHIHVDLKGYVFHEQIPVIYEKENFDLFINVSSSEGIPVSIMEAFAAGIPVMATNVGGTHELLNSQNGIILNPGITPSELANEIRSFFTLPGSVIQQMKLEAFETCKEKYDARKNASLLVSRLESL